MLPYILAQIDFRAFVSFAALLGLIMAVGFVSIWYGIYRLYDFGRVWVFPINTDTHAGKGRRKRLDVTGEVVYGKGRKQRRFRLHGEGRLGSGRHQAYIVDWETGWTYAVPTRMEALHWLAAKYKDRDDVAKEPREEALARIAAEVPDLESLTVQELRELATEYGVEVPAKAKKEELIAKLTPADPTAMDDDGMDPDSGTRGVRELDLTEDGRPKVSRRLMRALRFLLPFNPLTYAHATLHNESEDVLMANEPEKGAWLSGAMAWIFAIAVVLIAGVATVAYFLLGKGA